MILKQLLNLVVAKCCDVSVYCRSLLPVWIELKDLIPMLENPPEPNSKTEKFDVETTL